MYAATLPTPLLKAAAICAFLQGLLMIPFALRLGLAISGDTEEAANLDYMVGRGFVGVIIVVHVLLAASNLAAIRMLSGRLWASIVVLVTSPLCALVSLMGLLTGALAGIFGMFLATIAFLMAAITIPAVRRIARARDALEKLSE